MVLIIFDTKAMVMTLSIFIAICFTVVVLLYILGIFIMLKIRERVRKAIPLGFLGIANGLLVITWYLTALAGIIAIIWYIFT